MSATWWPCVLGVIFVFKITHNLSIIPWNVRGLGHPDRCGDVLFELIAQCPFPVALQETKLINVDVLKHKLFLPSHLSTFVACPSGGASFGILTVWDSTILSTLSTDVREFSLKLGMALIADGTPLTMTNVYAPTTRSDKTRFLAELSYLAMTILGPWLIIGNYNLTRTPMDKNKETFNFQEARTFNGLINSLDLIEIPLVDRAFTWSNRRDDPTLVRLDCCLVNLDWDEAFPNICLTSLMRAASNHVPLLVKASTTIPKGARFHFENAWLHHLAFKE